MTQRTTTRCDCCGTETADPIKAAWSKIVLHPSGEPTPEVGEPTPERWLIRDICPACAEKIKGWLTGSLLAVFRKPKGKKGK